MLRSTLTVKLVILLSSVLALAQFRTVTVQNANSNPVPTTIQNSGPIPMTIQNDSPIATTVTNTPTVNAAITNTPTVTIKDTVPVQVSGIVNTAITNAPTVTIKDTVPVQVSGIVNTAITNAPTVTIKDTVPVQVGGTVNTTVTNTPTVNINGTVPVQVGGTVNAAITNTPTVSVSNLPTGTAGPTNTTVVLVKSLDNPAQQPFQTAVSCATPAGLASKCTANYSVPAGKEFVIEYLQVSSTGNVTNGIPHYEVLTTAGGQALTYLYAAGIKLTSDSASDEHIVRIYADPGSMIQFTGAQTVTGAGITFNLVMSGHLVNTP